MAHTLVRVELHWARSQSAFSDAAPGSAEYLLPHPEAAWVLIEERLRDAALFAVRCGELSTLAVVEPLAKVAGSLEKHADQLLAAK